MEYPQEISNKQAYETFLNKPMQASVKEITKYKLRLWFTDGVIRIFRKSRRKSHMDLRIGDLETFVVNRIIVKDDYRHVLNIVGKDNSLLPRVETTKKKAVVKTKKSKLRNFKAGTQEVVIHLLEEDRTILTIGGERVTIYTPKIFKDKIPPLEKEIKIILIHKDNVSEKGTKFVSGIITWWGSI